MEPQSGVKTWQWVVTVIVIIVLIVIGILVFGNKSGQTPTGEENATSTNETPGAVNRITMTDQYPGNVVYLSSVQLQKPGYVAIQKDNNGVPGAVIGSAHFDAGINPGKITLTSPMVDGSTYYAVLYNDDGSGKFDASTATQVKDQNGNVILHVFKSSTSVGAGLKG